MRIARVPVRIACTPVAVSMILFRFILSAMTPRMGAKSEGDRRAEVNSATRKALAVIS